MMRAGRRVPLKALGILLKGSTSAKWMGVAAGSYSNEA